MPMALPILYCGMALQHLLSIRRLEDTRLSYITSMSRFVHQLRHCTCIKGRRLTSQVSMLHSRSMGVCCSFNHSIALSIIRSAVRMHRAVTASVPLSPALQAVPAMIRHASLHV